MDRAGPSYALSSCPAVRTVPDRQPWTTRSCRCCNDSATAPRSRVAAPCPSAVRGLGAAPNALSEQLQSSCRAVAVQCSAGEGSPRDTATRVPLLAKVCAPRPVPFRDAPRPERSHSEGGGCTPQPWLEPLAAAAAPIRAVPAHAARVAPGQFSLHSLEPFGRGMCYGASGRRPALLPSAPSAPSALPRAASESRAAAASLRQSGPVLAAPPGHRAA